MSNVNAEIEHAEDARYKAMIDRDYAALERLLADDLLYTHSSAVTDTKQSYLESLKSGRTRYLAARRDGVVIRGYGDVAGVPANLRYFRTAFAAGSRVREP